MSQGMRIVNAACGAFGLGVAVMVKDDLLQAANVAFGAFNVLLAVMPAKGAERKVGL